MKDVAVGESADECRRDDIHHERHEADFVGKFHVRIDHRRIEFADVDIHAGARLQDVDGEQANDQRHRGHHLEINEGLDRDPANPRHVRHVRDAGDYRAENNRRNQHADELDEGVAERTHLHGEVWIGHAERDTSRHADQYPDPELSPPRPGAARLCRQGVGGGRGRVHGWSPGGHALSAKTKRLRRRCNRIAWQRTQ